MTLLIAALEETRDPIYIREMLRIMKESLPDLQTPPPPSRSAFSRWLAWSEAFDTADAEELIDEISERGYQIDRSNDIVTPEMVAAIRQVVARNATEVRVPKRFVAEFVVASCEAASLIEATHTDTSSLLKAVKSAISLLKKIMPPQPGQNDPLKLKADSIFAKNAIHIMEATHQKLNQKL